VINHQTKFFATQQTKSLSSSQPFNLLGSTCDLLASSVLTTEKVSSVSLASNGNISGTGVINATRRLEQDGSSIVIPPSKPRRSRAAQRSRRNESGGGGGGGGGVDV